jgi:hypothetical protein
MGWIESVCGENCSLPVETNAEPQLRAELSEIVSLKSATGRSPIVKNTCLEHTSSCPVVMEKESE